MALFKVCTTATQWNFSNTDTFGPKKCVLIRGVSFNSLPTKDGKCHHGLPIGIYMGGLILGVILSVHGLYFFKLFLMVGKELRGVPLYHQCCTRLQGQGHCIDPEIEPRNNPGIAHPHLTAGRYFCCNPRSIDYMGNGTTTRAGQGMQSCDSSSDAMATKQDAAVGTSPTNFPWLHLKLHSGS